MVSAQGGREYATRYIVPFCFCAANYVMKSFLGIKIFRGITWARVDEVPLVASVADEHDPTPSTEELRRRMEESDDEIVARLMRDFMP